MKSYFTLKRVPLCFLYSSVNGSTIGSCAQDSNLAIALDFCCFFTTHIDNTHLNNYLAIISGTCPVFSITAAPIPVQAPIISFPDYCNALLTGLPSFGLSDLFPTLCHGGLPEGKCVSFPCLKPINSNCLMLTMPYNKWGWCTRLFITYPLFTLHPGFSPFPPFTPPVSHTKLLVAPLRVMFFPWAQWPLSNLPSG